MNLRNRQPQLRFTALFARAMRFGRAGFCRLTAPRCADSTDFNRQDLTWQSRSVFDMLGRGRINSKNVSKSIHSEQPALTFAIHPCESVKSVVQKSKHQTTSHTHANQATATQSTTKLPIRRANAQMKSAIESTRWGRAVSVRTIIGIRGTAVDKANIDWFFTGSENFIRSYFPCKRSLLPAGDKK